MDLGIDGMTALVTGASRGIGRAIAETLADEGARVAVIARSRDDLEKMFPDSASGHALIQLDLMAEGAVPALRDALEKQGFGPPGIVVNNLGGTLDVTDPFAPIGDWQRVMRFNFEIAVELVNMFVGAMRRQGWGRIVNIASVAAVELNGPASYAAAKAALVAYTRCVGRLLAADGIVMSSVLPGVVRTAGGYWEELEDRDPERVKEYLATRCPLGRFGSPDEIAGLVAYLCSKHASFNPGAVFSLDGGQLRGYSVS